MHPKVSRCYPILKGSTLSLIIALSAMQPVHARPSQLPLSITYAVEPNVMILFDTSGSMGNSMTDANGNSSTRLQIGKDAITQLIEDIEGIRFGVTTFNNRPSISNFSTRGDGAYLQSSMVLSSDETDLANMITAINDLDDYGTTPVQDAYYDLTRYYRHMTPYFGIFPSSYDDPIRYRCQSNSIISVTDGDPQKDWDHKSVRSCDRLGSSNTFGRVDDQCTVTRIDLSDDPDANWNGNGSGPSLPDWDRINGVYPSGHANAGSTIIDGVRPYPEYSDGVCAGDVYSSACRNLDRHTHSANLFLDDLAKFAYDIDLKKSGNDDAGKSFQDPKFLRQNISTHTIGFNIDAQMLRDAASTGYGHGTYKSASSASDLKDALEAAILTSVGGRGAGAGATQASISLDDNGETNVYVTEYNSDSWSGELVKIVVSEDSVSGDLEASKVWSASKVYTPANIVNRNIFSQDGSATTPTFAFNYANLSRLADPASMGDNTTAINGGKTLAELTIDYLSGVQTYEQTAAADADKLFRTRVSPLGDLIHSRPTFVRNQNFGYTDDDYGDYVLSNAKDESGARDATLYVGGNDGMLHAYKESDGSETFAFIPKTVQSELANIADESFNTNHQYFVDGDMSIVDVRINDLWSTVLVSPLGGGFKGVFMLDVTDPNASHANLFKWEINEKTTNLVNGSNVRVFSKMGYILNNPKVVRFQIPDGSGGGFHEKWVVVFGNGVHSEDANDNDVIGKAAIYVVDMESGELITEILLDNGYIDQDTTEPPAYSKLSRGNGVTSVTAVDVSTNSYIDRLYAADLKGQLWRINYDYLESDDPSNDNTYLKDKLTVAFNPGNKPAPIFTATGPVRADQNDTAPTGSVRQPISAEITVTKAPLVADSRIGEMIFFGTGQYFDFRHILNKDNLNVQSFYAIWDKGNWDTQSDPVDKSDDLIEQTFTETATERVLTNATIDYEGSDLGWYIDLPTYGERIIRKPIGIFSHIAFFSQIPKDPDVCIAGNNAWSMVARRDTATSLVTDGTSLPTGTKHTGIIQDPIFVETTSGRLIAPAFILSEDSDDVSVDNIVDIQKDYARSSWKRLQF